MASTVRRSTMRIGCAITALVAAASGCVHTGAAASADGRNDHEVVGNISVPKAVTRIMDADDRSAIDVDRDVALAGAELLAMAHPSSKARVLDLAPGDGYFTELLVRAASDGVVFAPKENTDVDSAVRRTWSERLLAPAMKPVTLLDADPRARWPDAARNLDLVVLSRTYHETVFQSIDRAAMNRAVFDALVDGGGYLVVDARARDGGGLGDARTLGRVDPSLVRSEVEAAGFTLEVEATFLRNPADACDWKDGPSSSPDRRGRSDTFVYLFRKPKHRRAPPREPDGY